MKRTIRISAKCSDLFWMALEEDGMTVGEYDGYVPDWFPNPEVNNGGDYVILEIDLDTGKILNWKKPTGAQLSKVFKR